MKINNITSPNFKGYDAVPLKALHMGTLHKRIEQELRQIAQNEGFEVKASGYNESFNQDFKVILNQNGTPHLKMQANMEIFGPHLSDIEKQYGMKTTMSPMFSHKNGFVSGGNFFLGKKPDGTKWILIGAADQKFGKDIDKISEFYGVDKENIHFIAQQDYHLDMSIRPIGYPYVLVNSPKMANKNKEKIRGKQRQTGPNFDALIKARTREYEKMGIPKENIHFTIPENAGKSNEEIKIKAFKQEIETLENAGFCPIPIGGVYDDGVNFLNAVVNIHPDGTISYITNSSKSTNPLDTKFQRLFEKDLRKKLKELETKDPNAPKLRDVYFVEGELYDFGNEMTENILEGSGGIHCMTLEEPNFEAWG